MIEPLIEVKTKAETKAETNKKTQEVVDIGKYKKTAFSTFELVMSQVNIAGYSAFEKKLAQYWTEAASEEQLLSVLICEIDFYNEYAANHGEQGASFMLLVVALALKNICEQHEHDCFLAHYEQGKFAILIKGGDKKSDLEISERLCKAVAASRTEHKHSKVSNIVTLSVGISAAYPESMAILKSKANNALHNAQISGFNRVSNDSRKKKQVVTETELEMTLPTTEQKREKQDTFAPKQNIAAPNMSKKDFFAEPQTEKSLKSKNKQPSVRMYRGHPIDS